MSSATDLPVHIARGAQLTIMSFERPLHAAYRPDYPASLREHAFRQRHSIHIDVAPAYRRCGRVIVNLDVERGIGRLDVDGNPLPHPTNNASIHGPNDLRRFRDGDYAFGRRRQADSSLSGCGSGCWERYTHIQRYPLFREGTQILRR